LGFRTIQEMVGRADMLEIKEAVDHWKARGLDFSNIFYKPAVPTSVGTHCVRPQDHALERALDNDLIKLCSAALDHKSRVRVDLPISNTNRTVGTMLSGEVARRYGADGLPEDTIQIKFTGSAGQSFGTFLAKGISFTLEGDANDYLGKGISGGRIVAYPPTNSTFIPEENILVGNTVLYGATGGEVYLRGVAGERFAVRNSGAKAVVEGVGDHGCEYMTGGVVVVLGRIGRNFAAGMSGGIAYVLDEQDCFASLCNQSMVDLEPVVDSNDIETLKTLIERHYRFTESSLAQRILENWEILLPKFMKVMPQDYRRAFLQLEQEKVMAAHMEQELAATQP
jgi:glutamate synthase domain-containing protein 3